MRWHDGVINWNDDYVAGDGRSNDGRDGMDEILQQSHQSIFTEGNEKKPVNRDMYSVSAAGAFNDAWH